MFSSHLTVLETSAKLYATAPAFKVPQVDASGSVQEWQPISYQQFQLDVERFSRHWARVLRTAGVAQRSVVGLWWVDPFGASDYFKLITIIAG